jgi:hypothetical protein
MQTSGIEEPILRYFDFSALNKLHVFGKSLRQKFSNPSKMQFTICGPSIEPWGIPDFGWHLSEIFDSTVKGPIIRACNQALSKKSYFLDKG